MLDEIICTQVLNYLANSNSVKNLKGYVGIYWPLAGEVDLRSLATTLELPLALPASKYDRSLSYHQWGDSLLLKDLQGIPAPIDQPSLQAKELKLLLVPALSIDHLGIRLGYGGGFFDRLRTNDSWRSIPAFVVLPQVCVSSVPLPRDTWDVPFNGWITEEGITFRSRIDQL